MKKTLLASCVALVSATSQAELSPMSEFELHNVTGQAGVDIQLDVGVSIGEILYTDTEEFDAAGVSDGDGGSLSIKDIYIGGDSTRNTVLGVPVTSNTDRLDNLTFQIDVENDGTLVVSGVPVEGAAGVGAVDLSVKVGEIALVGSDPADRHVLVDSISMYGGASGLQMIVDGPTNDIFFISTLGFSDIDIDMSSSFGLVIEDMVLAGSSYLEFEKTRFDPQLEDRTASFYVRMDSDSVDDGVLFDFASPFDDYNVVDIDVASISLGDGAIGRLTLNNLDFKGVSFVVSGH
jgi:hypothetical protein